MSVPVEIEAVVEDLVERALSRLHQERREESAEVIQRFARKKVIPEETPINRQRRAAQMIQALVRGFLVRRRFSLRSEGKRDVGVSSTELARDSVAEPPRIESFIEIPEVDNFDRRNPAEKSQGRELYLSVLARGPVYFSSPKYAKAYLQEVTQLEARESNLRRSIQKQVERIHKQFRKATGMLTALHTVNEEKVRQFVRREERFRDLVNEEMDLHWAAIIRLHISLVWGEQWTEMYFELANELLKVEQRGREAIEKDQMNARASLAVEEVAAKRLIGQPQKPKKLSSMKEAQSYSKAHYGFSESYQSSLVHLHTRRELQRVAQLSDAASRAAEVREENQYFEEMRHYERTRIQTANFARAVRQRDDAKTRRKEWSVHRLAQLESLREAAKREQLESRRSVHEQRNPRERYSFSKLLAPIREVSDQTVEQLSAVRAASSPARRTSAPAKKSPQRVLAESPPPSTANPVRRPRSLVDRPLFPTEDKLRLAVTELHLFNGSTLQSKAQPSIELLAYSEEINAVVQRALNWNDRGKTAIHNHDYPAAETALMNATQEARRAKQLLLTQEGGDAQEADRCWHMLESITTNNRAVLSRCTKQLRLALKQLIEVLSIEEKLYGEGTPEALLNVSAVLVQLDEPREALSYARSAEDTLCRRAKTMLQACRRGETGGNVSSQSLYHLAVAALHNVAMAQAVCPTTAEHAVVSNDALLLAAERHTCRTTYQAAHQLGDMLLGVNHPLTHSVQSSASRIAALLSNTK